MSSNSDDLVTQKSDSIVEKSRRFLFGDDIFISYSRVDSTYALSLANELTKRNLSCFLDQWGTPPGEELPKELINTIKRCSTMVLIGSKNAAASDNVGLEVKKFLQTRRPIIPITFVADHLFADTPEDFNPQNLVGTLEQANWYPSIAGIAKTTEILSALKTRVPSENIILRIVKATEFRSRSKRLRKTFFAILGAIVILLLLGSFAVYKASAEVSAAEAKRIQAETNANAAIQSQNAAIQSQKDAEGKLSSAQQELSNTNASLVDTKNQLASASSDLKNAETQLNQTKKDLTTSQSELTNTKAELGDTKTDLEKQIVLLRDAKIKTESARIVSGVGQDKNTVTSTELNLIWNLATANDVVRYSFVEQIFDSPIDATRFSNRADLLTQAAIGLSEERRDYALNSFILPRLQNPSLPFAIRLASVDMGVTLGIKNKELAALALPVIVEAIQKTNDPNRRDILADELLFVTGQLEPEQVSRFYQELLEDAEKNHKVLKLSDYKAVEAVLKKLSPERAPEAFTRITAAMKAIPDKAESFYEYHFWVTALSSVPGELSPEHRKIALDKLFSNKLLENDYLRQDTLKILFGKVNKNDVLNTIEQVMTAYEKPVNGYYSKNLSEALNEAAVMLTPETAPKAMNRVLRTILKNQYSFDLDYLFPALEIIREKMSDEDKKKAAAEILQVLKQSLQNQTGFDSGHFAKRLNALAIISLTLSTEDAGPLLSKIISIIEAETNNDYYKQKVQTLFALVNIMNPRDAHRILMDALKNHSNADSTKINANFIGVVANVLGSINDVIPPEELRLIYGKILNAEAIMKNYGRSSGLYLKDGIKSIARKVPLEEAKQVCTQLSSKIFEPSSDIFYNHVILAEGIAALPEQICGRDSENALQLIASPMESSIIYNAMEANAWTSSVQNVSGKLTAANSQAVLNILLKDIKSKSRTIPFEPGLETAMKNAVKALVEKSKPEDVPILINHIVSAYEKLDETVDDKSELDNFRIPFSKTEKLYINSYLAQTIAVLPCESNPGEIEKMWKELLFKDSKSVEQAVEGYVDDEYKETIRQAVKEGIKSLSSCLSSAEAPNYLEFVINSLEFPASSNERDIQQSLLPVIAKKVSNKDTQQVFTRLLKLINLATDWKKRESLIEAVKNLPGVVDRRILVETLKSPVCVGSLRSVVIDKLEKETNRDFKGDIWAVVRWAQAEGIDVVSLPEKPSNP